LDASEEQLDFDFIYASAKEGWAAKDMSDPQEDMTPLLDAIVNNVPPPVVEDGPFRMLVTFQEHDAYLGRIVTGRVFSGKVAVGDRIHALATDHKAKEAGRVTKLFGRQGMKRIEVSEAGAGEVVSIAGLAAPTVSYTMADTAVSEALSAPPIDPPTISMTFSVNDSPLGGKTGKQLTSQKIRERLKSEQENNISISLRATEGRDDAVDVLGRGEMQLGILIETMRREGFELSVAPPQVVFQYAEGGKRLEPIEEVMCEVEDDYTGSVIQELSNRKGELLEMNPASEGRTRLLWKLPSRGMIGYRSKFYTDTRGTGIMYSTFDSYAPHMGSLAALTRGAIVSMSSGTATAYQLAKLEPRGQLFIKEGDQCYEGMVIGEHSRDSELPANPCQKKALTNIRTTNTDENIRLTPPRTFTLEEAISYVGDDELIEVTPVDVRLRKRVLSEGARKASRRQA